MGHTLKILPNFAGGELSPLLDMRLDLPAYSKGLRQLRNLIALKTGGATRRPGTQFIALGKAVAGSTAVSRFVKFQFAPGTTFQLEFCHQGIRFCSNGAQVKLSSAPAWVSGTSYAAGSFVSYGGQIWYTPAVIINSTVAPAPGGAWTLQNVYEVPAPYSAINFTGQNYWAADVFVLQAKQINDVVYITHPNFPVYKLVRYGDTNWVMAPVQFNVPAMLDQNATDTTLTAGATSGTGVSLAASAPNWATATYYQPGNSVIDGGQIYVCQIPHTSGTFSTDLANGLWLLTPIFNAKHVGSYWQMAFNPPASAALINEPITMNDTTSPIQTIGTWSLITYGTWAATIALEASYDNGVHWQTVTTITSNSDANYNIQGQAVITALYRLVITNYSSVSSATPPRVTFTPDNSFVYGLVQITAVTDAYNATCSVIIPLYATTATVYWSEGAWSDYRGYPTAIAVFQERAWYGGTAYQPQRLWGTQTNDLENFALLDQSQATDGLAFDLNAPGQGPIQWINAQTDLAVGLAGGEWIVSSGQPNTSISPTQIIALQHSANGSVPNLPGAVVGNATFYVQRKGTSFMQMLFSVFTEKYMSQDLQVLSQHLTASRIKQFDFQQEFQNQEVLWAVTGNGHLIGMTYDMEQQVFSWHDHTTGDVQVYAGSFIVGTQYTIGGPGTTDWFAIGAPSNKPGTVFTATGSGSGTGWATTALDFGFLSVSVNYGAAGQDDEVWVTCLRKGMTQCTLERIDPDDWQTDNAGMPVPANACYADLSSSFTSPASATFPLNSTMGNFWSGRSLVASLNGVLAFRNLTPFLMSTVWQVTLPNYTPKAGDVVVIGLPINWSMRPMKFDTVGPGEPVPGITKALFKAYVRRLNSVGGKYMTESGIERDIPVYPIIQNSGNLPPFVPNLPNEVELPIGGDSAYSDDPQITLYGSDPLPQTILGLTLKIDVGGRP